MEKNVFFADRKRPAAPLSPGAAAQHPASGVAFGHRVDTAGLSPDRRCGTDSEDAGSIRACRPAWRGPVLPDQVLDQVMGYLGLKDLVRCRKVCRQWYRLASRPALQARSLMRSYPVEVRTLLEQTIDTRLARDYLSPWREHLAADDAHWKSLVLQRTLTPPRLLFSTLVQLRACSDRFAAGGARQGRCGNRPVRYLVCSKDGRYLATATWKFQENESTELTVWRAGPTAVTRSEVFHPVCDLRALVFGANSRSLQGLDRNGQLWQWQRDEQQQWHSLGHSRLYAGAVVVRHAVASPDGQTLAVLTADESLSVFGKAATGHWHRHWCHDQGGMVAGEDGQPMIAIVEMLEFDSQSQHLLMASDRKVWALRKERGLWQETAVQGSILPSSDGLPPGAGVVLAVQGEHCAALFWQGWDDLDAHHARFLLKWWYCAAGQGWQSVMERQCPMLVVRSAPMTPVMAFSPDGRQLALLERQQERQQLCILSVTADPVILPQPFDVTPAAFCRLGHLAFNATGRYCAAGLELRGTDRQSGPGADPVRLLALRHALCRLYARQPGRLGCWSRWPLPGKNAVASWTGDGAAAPGVSHLPEPVYTRQCPVAVQYLASGRARRGQLAAQCAPGAGRRGPDARAGARGRLQHGARLIGQPGHPPAIQAQLQYFDRIIHSLSPSRSCQGSSDKLVRRSVCEETMLSPELTDRSRARLLPFVGLSPEGVSRTAQTAPHFSFGTRTRVLLRPFATNSSVLSLGLPLDSRRWYC